MTTRSPARKAAAVPAKKAAAKPKDAPVAAKPAAKVAIKAASKPAAKPAAPKEKLKKTKLVRDSFTMPEAEYEVLGQVKKACIKAGFEVKKSELLRIGVALIKKMEISQLKSILTTLPPLKAGRPKKSK